MSLADMERLFDGISLADITTSMTINPPAPIFAMYLVVAEQQGADQAVVGDDPERHPEGVHRPEGIHLPAAALDAADHRHLPVLREGRAEVEHDFCERLSHSVRRVRRHCRNSPSPCATASNTCSGGSTPGWTWTTSCLASRSSTRIRISSKRLPASGRAQDLGARDARPLRRQGRAIAEAEVPLADRRCLAHRPAALQQRRAHGSPGAISSSGAPIPSTPTRSTKRWPCRRRKPPLSHCARSRSLRTRAA